VLRPRRRANPSPDPNGAIVGAPTGTAPQSNSPLTGRSLLGAALVVVAVGLVLAAHRAAVTPSGSPVVVLATDVRAGSTLRAEDLLLVRLDLPEEVTAVPAEDAAGLIGAGMARDGERGTVLTPSDIEPAGGGLARSVRVSLATDPERTPGGLRPGMRVDILSTDVEEGRTELIVSGASITQATVAGDESIGSSGPTLVELAVPDPLTAAAVVDASVRHEVTLVLPPGSSGPVTAGTSGAEASGAETGGAETGGAEASGAEASGAETGGSNG